MTTSTEISQEAAALFAELVKIIAKLRNPQGGCPWDLEQTHQTLKPYLIEEAYEAIDAIDTKPDKLSEELGDVLLQVMLHSQVAKDNGAFDIREVVRLISQKLIKRHPHVFGETQVKDAKQVLQNWEAIKRSDRPKEESLLAGIPKALPALLQAQRIGSKVERVGFDWNDAQEIKLKIREELEEFLGAAESNEDHTKEEFGDLLFTIAQLARKLSIDSEDALAQANRKFMTRFASLEKMAKVDLATLSREELEALWQAVKKAEKLPPA